MSTQNVRDPLKKGNILEFNTEKAMTAHQKSDDGGSQINFESDGMSFQVVGTS